MKVDIKANTIIQADIDEIESFKILCKTLHMDFVLDEDTDYFVREGEFGENGVYVTYGHDIKIDDRGDLFVGGRFNSAKHSR